MFEELSVMGRVREFEKRHGPERYNDGAMIYYADGAQRDVDPIGALIEPPTSDTPEGEHVLARNKLTFARLKLRTAVRQFDDLNTRLAYSIPADEDEELAALKQLKRRVDECKGLVEDAEAELGNTQIAQRQAESRRMQAEERERISSFHARRKAIRV